MNWKRFGIYALRWQLGGIIIAPILWLLLEYLELQYIAAMVIMQLIGAAIFYPIDMWIARQKTKSSRTTNTKSKVIELSNFGNVICEDKVDEIYNLIRKSLNEGVVEISFEGVDTFQAIFAERVFGRLYNDIGSDDYVTKLIFKEQTDNHRILIRTGIERAIKSA